MYKVYELKNEKTILDFLSTQNYNNILDKLECYDSMHSFNLKSDTLYRTKHNYFEYVIADLNLDRLFIQYVTDHEQEFPNLEDWLMYGIDHIQIHYSTECDGDLIDYDVHLIMYEFISTRQLTDFWLKQITKLLLLVDIRIMVNERTGYVAATYIFSEMNIETDSDILFYDYLNKEYIDVVISKPHQLMFNNHHIIHLNKTNTRIELKEGMRLTRFRRPALKNILNDKITTEYFNEQYIDRIEENLQMDEWGD